MKKITLSCSSLSGLPDVAAKILSFAGTIKVFAFYGELGAGKTALIKEICKQLNVRNAVTSPTYSIINEYECRNGIVIYHFDFYRLKDVIEIYDLGYEDYFYSDNYCFIEWPEKAEKLLPAVYVKTLINREKSPPDAAFQETGKKTNSREVIVSLVHQV